MNTDNHLLLPTLVPCAGEHNVIFIKYIMNLNRIIIISTLFIVILVASVALYLTAHNKNPKHIPLKKSFIDKKATNDINIYDKEELPEDLLKIAVPIFKPLSNSKEELYLSEIISQTLSECIDLINVMSIVDIGDLKQYPNLYGIKKENIDFSFWSGLSIDCLLIGGLKIEQEILIMELRVFNVKNEELILGKRYTGIISDYSYISNRFCSIMKEQFGN